jgi:hypothetical protein
MYTYGLWRLKLSEANYYEPIIVKLIEDSYNYDKKGKLPAHDLVIRPLLENCMYCYVYELKNDDELYINNKDILIKEKGKYKFDTTKECIAGHEYLWNATGGKRGTIIIILENNLGIFDKILKHTFIDIGWDIPVVDNPNAGNSISAVKKCKEEMKKGNIGICITRNNGLENMFIYIEQKYKDELLKMVMDNCNKIDLKKLALKRLGGMGI